MSTGQDTFVFEHVQLIGPHLIENFLKKRVAEHRKGSVGIVVSIGFGDGRERKAFYAVWPTCVGWSWIGWRAANMKLLEESP